MASNMLLKGLAVSLLSLTAAGCLDDLAATGAATAAQTETAPAAKQLHQLFADSDEAALKLSPISALFRGDMRYAGTFGDYITDDFIAQARRDAESEWRRLQEIDRGALNRQDQIAYDVFEYQTRQSLDALAPDIVALSVVRPIDHMNGLHIQYPDLNKSAGRFQTVQDYDNGLKRMEGFALYLERAKGRLAEGIKTRVVQPKLTVRLMIKQLDDLIAQGVEKSPFWQPVVDMPKTFADADRKRIADAYRAALTQKIIPAYETLRTFLTTQYLPKARAGIGLSAMPGGAKLYKLLVEQQTTTKLTADEIHKIGVAEVNRIKGEMDQVRRAVGFKGALPAFFEHLRTAKQFEPQSREDLQNRYADIAKRMDAAVVQDFSLVPKTKIELRPVPDYMEQSQAAGYYNPGTPDGTRPGVFFFNTYDLPSRKTWGMETLYLHEAVPGHHFQISLAQENESLPKFMRFGGNTAYVEGWALYAEWIGRELGFYKDPYQMFGHLNDEQLRALRLVVDTGIHAKGWSRERAVKYMLDNSALSVTETTQEVDRYIVTPGQALGYKVGQLTIKRLRRESETALGARFDVKAYHAQILDTGALPMDVLEAKIKHWLQTSK